MKAHDIASFFIIGRSMSGYAHNPRTKKTKKLSLLICASIVITRATMSGNRKRVDLTLKQKIEVIKLNETKLSQTEIANAATVPSLKSVGLSKLKIRSGRRRAPMLTGMRGGKDAAVEFALSTWFHDAPWKHHPQGCVWRENGRRFTCRRWVGVHGAAIHPWPRRTPWLHWECWAHSSASDASSLTPSLMRCMTLKQALTRPSLRRSPDRQISPMQLLFK